MGAFHNLVRTGQSDCQSISGVHGSEAIPKKVAYKLSFKWVHFTCKNDSTGLVVLTNGKGQAVIRNVVCLCTLYMTVHKLADNHQRYDHYPLRSHGTSNGQDDDTDTSGRNFSSKLAAYHFLRFPICTRCGMCTFCQNVHLVREFIICFLPYLSLKIHMLI